jgi:hypothetical protein
MTKKSPRQLTLDQPATYHIKIPGQLDANWRSPFAQDVTVAFDTDPDGLPVSILTGMFDQSALQGFLRHLYALGIPILSVLCLEGEQEN